MRDDIYDNGNTGNFFEKSNKSDTYVQSESDGLSVAKVLNSYFRRQVLVSVYHHRKFVRSRVQMGNNQELGVRSL